MGRVTQVWLVPTDPVNLTTFVLPATATNVTIACGGAGGAGSTTQGGLGGGGGGGGGIGLSTNVTGQAGRTLSILVGQGGSQAGGQVKDGEASFVKFQSTTLVRGSGGTVGHATDGTGGAGGGSVIPNVGDSTGNGSSGEAAS